MCSWLACASELVDVCRGGEGDGSPKTSSKVWDVDCVGERGGVWVARPRGEVCTGGESMRTTTLCEELGVKNLSCSGGLLSCPVKTLLWAGGPNGGSAGLPARPHILPFYPCLSCMIQSWLCRYKYLLVSLCNTSYCTREAATIKPECTSILVNQ
jgi:hypothetical protein